MARRSKPGSTRRTPANKPQRPAPVLPLALVDEEYACDLRRRELATRTIRNYLKILSLVVRCWETQLDRYGSRSRKQSVFEAARADLTAFYRGLDAAHPVDAVLDDGFDWDTLYAGDEPDLFDALDPFGEDGDRSPYDEEPVPAEDRAMMLHRFGRRVSGVTWSPGGAVSFVAYDKVLEGRLRGTSHMEPIWRANGWDGKTPVTRHEARLRREALHALGVPEQKIAEFDDPRQMLDRLQDPYGYVVGRPSTLSPAADCPPEVDVAWLRRVHSLAATQVESPRLL